MNEPLLRIAKEIVTPWKLVGYAGVLIFFLPLDGANTGLVEIPAPRAPAALLVFEHDWQLAVADLLHLRKD